MHSDGLIMSEMSDAREFRRTSETSQNIGNQWPCFIATSGAVSLCVVMLIVYFYRKQLRQTLPCVGEWASSVQSITRSTLSTIRSQIHAQTQWYILQYHP